MPIWPAPLFHFSLKKLEPLPLFNGAMVSTGASQSGGGRLVDIGRNRQPDVLIHISLTLAISPIARLVLIISGGVLVLLPLAALEALSGQPMTQTVCG